jgi:hypothetical protein
MKWSDLKAAMDGDDEDAKAAAYAAIAAAFPDDAPEGDEPEKKDADGDDEDKPKADAEDEPEKKDAEDAPEKKDAAIVAAVDAELRKVNARLADFERERDQKERATLIASREMSPALAKTLATKSIKTVREICAAMPAKAKIVTTESVQATRGEGQGDGRSTRLPAHEREDLDARMGLGKKKDAIRREGNKLVLGVMSAAEARAALAAKGGK